MQEREKAIPLQPLSRERAQVTENDMLKNSVLDPLWTVQVSYLGIVQGSEKVILPVSLKKLFRKKTSEKFGRMKKSNYLCIRFPVKTEAKKEERSLIDFR